MLETSAPNQVRPQPSIEAAFARESYRPGSAARLVTFSRARRVTLQVFRSGLERDRTRRNTEMLGIPVSKPISIGDLPGRRTLHVRVGDWPSGLYFARLTAVDGGIGFAPFVVRPYRLGEHAVAVVLPTWTWQAYNLRDDDGDGEGDTWYARWRNKTVRLARPFLNRGVPPKFRRYDLPFLRWLARTGKEADVLSDGDLDAVGGNALARAYRLIVFPGHHEYVTTKEYDAIERYRDRGGNLLFLSANNFFWRVIKQGNTLTKTRRWRDLGRPEAALIGVQYRANAHGSRRAPWIVRGAQSAGWLFAGTGLKYGSAFGNGGIEIDARASSSPLETQVLAEIPNLLGRGLTAHMTYYETRAGARVFAAGAFRLVGSADSGIVDRLLENLWVRLAYERPYAVRRETSGLRHEAQADRLADARTSVTAPAGVTRRTGAARKLPPETLRGPAHRLHQYPVVSLASPAERAAAEGLLAQAWGVARAWQNPRAAAAAGFDTKRPRRRAQNRSAVLWFHAERPRGSASDGHTLDVQRPKALIYADVPGRPLVLVGVMFSMQRGHKGPNPGGPITRWHTHRVCAQGERRGLKPRSDGSCPRGSTSRQGSEMMHVWFTRDLRSAFAIHAPVHELCVARLLPPAHCRHDQHRHR